MSSFTKTAMILNNSKAVSYCKVSSSETICREMTTKILNMFGADSPEKCGNVCLSKRHSFLGNPGNIWRENKKNQKRMLLSHEKVATTNDSFEREWRKIQFM